MKKKVTYIISDIDKALAFEWVAEYVDPGQVTLSFVLINNVDTELERFLKGKGFWVKRLPYHGAKSILSTVLKLIFLLRNIKPNAVHCHLRTATLLGIPAALLAGIQNRIYTRHSSTYNHLYHPKGVKIDKFLNRLSTKIIAISENIKNILIDWENVPSSKVELIHHGFDFTIWENISESEVTNIREKYSIPVAKTVIGIIARFTWWKGYEYSIPAIGNLMEKYPELILITANSKGNNKKEIDNLISKYIPSNKVIQIEFEKNLPALYKLFDIYVHVPIDESVEAFGQTYVEALIAGVPSVFTLSGIAPEFIEDRNNALVVPFKDPKSIEVACRELIENSCLANHLVENGKKSIQNFAVQSFVAKLETLYLQC